MSDKKMPPLYATFRDDRLIHSHTRREAIEQDAKDYGGCEPVEYVPRVACRECKLSTCDVDKMQQLTGDGEHGERLCQLWEAFVPHDGHCHNWEAKTT